MFPIPAWRKRPTGIVKSHSEDWSYDRSTWENWYAATGGCNFGVECGPGGVIAGDVDADAQGNPMFDPFWSGWASRDDSVCVVTPGGGWHVYLRVPAGIDATVLRQPDWLKGRINIRAGRGYVVAPFCQTRSEEDDQASTGEYRLVRDGASIPDAPPELLQHCQPGERRPEDAGAGPPVPSEAFDDEGFTRDSNSIGIRHRVGLVLDRIRSAVPGTRNATLNAAAMELGKLVAGGLMDKGWAYARLAEAATVAGLARDEIRATSRSGLTAGLASGERVPRSAMDALLMAPAPLVDRPALWASAPAVDPLAEPVVERLLIEGNVTVLSGASGTGKTTIGASLMAAATVGLRNFSVPGFTNGSHSDIGIREACWLCVSYEGGQYMALHKQAWHKGLGLEEQFRDRQKIISFRSPLIYTDAKRNTLIDKAQSDTISREIDLLRRHGLPVILIVDNISSAIEDSTDPTQCSTAMRHMRNWAETNIAVLLFGHPP